MHLLFYGKEQVRFLEYKTVEQLLHEQSIKVRISVPALHHLNRNFDSLQEGKLYDSPDSVASIPSFIATYSIQVSELLYPDISSYKTFNEFFYRKLREDARPVQNAEDPNAFCSAADSRMMVFDNLDQATSIWSVLPFQFLSENKVETNIMGDIGSKADSLLFPIFLVTNSLPRILREPALPFSDLLRRTTIDSIHPQTSSLATKLTSLGLFILL